MTENLWGVDAIDESPDSVPKKLLADQAGLLETITKGHVLGTVKTERIDEVFQQTLVMFAPALDDVQVTILTVSHGAFMYPCKVISDVHAVALECNGDSGLRQIVRQVLSHEKTTARIRALVAQSKAA